MLGLKFTGLMVQTQRPTQNLVGVTLVIQVKNARVKLILYSEQFTILGSTSQKIGIVIRSGISTRVIFLSYRQTDTYAE